MPHVVVKHYPGPTENQKQALSDAIAQAVKQHFGSADQSISIGIEEVGPQSWAERVYRPEVVGKADTLYKKPGYSM